MKDSLFHNKRFYMLSVGLLWLFQVSGIIGISLGHHDWFLSKTPLLLMITMVVLIIHYPIDSPKKIGIGLFLMLSGMVVEWIGVHHDFLFGPYYYGENLGPKVFGVPYLIGVNWMVLVLATSAIANTLFNSKWQIIVAGASLMILLDFFIEKSAPLFDFWIWQAYHAPLRNYISWFVIAIVLHTVTVFSKSTSINNIGWHIYLSQVLFFGYFYVYHSI